MSTPVEIPESEPMRWFEPVVGLVFALLVLGGLGVAVAVSYDDGGSSSATHEEEGEHG